MSCVNNISNISNVSYVFRLYELWELCKPHECFHELLKISCILFLKNLEFIR